MLCAFVSGDGDIKMGSINRIIPLKWKFFLKCIFGGKNTWKDYAEYIDPEKRKIVVALAADYGNLGDVAITIAQEQFLKRNFPDCQIIDFPIAMTYSHMKSLKEIVKEDDIITIVGGGNMGDVYCDIEECRRFVLKQFPKNKVVSFPQSILFLNPKNLKKCCAAYSKHRRLSLVAREEYSYKIMKENFPENRVLLTPDIVLSMKPESISATRNGVLLLIRDDKEAILDGNLRQNLVNSLVQLYQGDIADTVIETPRMSIETRKRNLCDLLVKIQSAEVVITNRLHGMIFCAITATPCVVLPIKGDKIVGALKWIEEITYIKYCQDYSIDAIQGCVAEVRGKGSSPVNIDEKFTPLVKALSEL